MHSISQWQNHCGALLRGNGSARVAAKIRYKIPFCLFKDCHVLFKGAL